LRDLGARPVVAVERHAQILEELRAIAEDIGDPPSNTTHEWVATFGLINPVHQIAREHKFLYLLSERYQFATVRRFASFA
jgi:hypothetical protein